MQCCCACVRNCDFKEETDFAGYTSLHGVKRLTGGRPWYAKVLWVLACLGGWTVLLLQLSYLIIEYRLYKTTTSISLIPAGEKERNFPAVTICGFNRINGTALEKELNIPRNDTELLEYILNSFDTLSISEKITQERVDKIHQKYTNYSGREWNLTEILEIASKKNVNRFIRQCLYWHNFPDPENVNCASETAFVHSYTTYGSCLTFNHFQAQFIVKDANHAGVVNGLTLVIDLDPNEITGTLESGYEFDGLRLHVHPKHEPPQQIEDQGYVVRPGSYATVSISTEKYVNEKDWPWGICGSFDLANYPEYSRSGCDFQCKSKYISEKCGCNPFAISGTTNGTRFCETFDIDNCTSRALFQYQSMSEVERSEGCGFQVCIYPCTFYEYPLIVSSAAYPSPWFRKLYLKQTGSTRENSIRLDINFDNMYVREYKEEKARTFTQLLSDFGGQMGLCIGASVLTVAEIGEYLTFKIQLLCCWFKKHKKPGCRHDFASKQVEMKTQANVSSNLVA